MKRLLNIFRTFGLVLAFFAVLMTAPAAVSFIFDDGLAAVYLLYAAAVFVVGAVLWLAGFRYRQTLQIRDGFLLVTLIWSTLPCFAALPLMAVVPDLTFTKAYFEATSGLTASGGTVLSGLDDLPPSLNFWRGETTWIGGMGLIVLVVAILPLLGVGGRGMFQTEIPGPLKDKKLTPQIAQTAKGLWTIYAGLTALCALAYFLAGMSWLDAVIHGFTTMGLGGFSSHDASYAYFDSPAIETIAIIFMIIAGMNFAAHFNFFKLRSFRPYITSIECRAYLTILAVAVVVVAFYLNLNEVYGDWGSTFRYAVFNTVSIVTTTGYSNADFAAWPLFAPLLILLLANITACSGSTGGGIKLMRALVAFYQSASERRQLIHPRAYYDNPIGGGFPQRLIVSILFFILAYIVAALILMLLLAATGMDFLTAFSAAVASISNTGPGLGEVGPSSNYGHLSGAQIWLCSFAMLIGRLELLSFIVVINRDFWRY